MRGGEIQRRRPPFLEMLGLICPGLKGHLCQECSKLYLWAPCGDIKMKTRHMNLKLSIIIGEGGMHTSEPSNIMCQVAGGTGTGLVPVLKLSV